MDQTNRLVHSDVEGGRERLGFICDTSRLSVIKIKGSALGRDLENRRRPKATGNQLKTFLWFGAMGGRQGMASDGGKWP